MKTFVIITLILIGLYIPSWAQYTQEPLPYAYDALEPFVDARTMEIHYSKHHAGYVAKLNEALSQSDNGGPTDLIGLLGAISSYPAAVRNNAGGHYNHTLFWKILTPEKNTRPSDMLQKAIDRDFSGIDALKKQLLKEASARFGSGWAWLVVTSDKKLVVLSTPNQDNPLMDDVPVRGVPVLGIDVWEHAYYLKYQNRRAEYLEALWNVINWDEVSRLYEREVE
ncbi:MAG TPA: superoxide dismutase [Prolixibacteraceae bacterium]|nr:superoxide dismutase [Prolixibacteraceae bacterium]